MLERMKILAVISVLFIGVFVNSNANFYEESIGEMLSQCTLHQHNVQQANRTKHLCEKPDFDDDFSYFITPMETKYSRRKFLCFLFFKDEYFKLKFKLWFSHANYSVNAVSNKFYMISPSSFQLFFLVWCKV